MRIERTNWDGADAPGLAGRLRALVPALGHMLGGGGRYDELMGRFGRPLPAAGFALYLERVHIAQAEEERLGVES